MQDQRPTDVLIEKALLLKSCNPGAQNITVTKCANGEIKTTITWPKVGDNASSGAIKIVEHKASGATHIRWVQSEEPASVQDGEAILQGQFAPQQLGRTPSLHTLSHTTTTEPAYTETNAATVMDGPAYLDARFVTPEPGAARYGSVLQTPRKRACRAPEDALSIPMEQSYLALRFPQPAGTLRDVRIDQWREEVHCQLGVLEPGTAQGKGIGGLRHSATTRITADSIGGGRTESCYEDDEESCVGSYHLPSSGTGEVRGKALYIRRYFDAELGEWMGETNMTKRDLDSLPASHHLAKAIREYGVDIELPEY